MAALTQHTYSNKPPRYYIDGVRVSRDAYELHVQMARMYGTYDCFRTVCKPYGNGMFHRINYSHTTTAR